MRDNRLLELVREEIDSYWSRRPSRLGLIYLISTSLVNTVFPFFIIVFSLYPLVVYEGFILSGYISLTSYQLFTGGSGISYPHLDSLTLISWFNVFFALVILSLSIISLLGFRENNRSWSILIPVTSLGNALLSTLTYSILRVYVFDAIPTLPESIFIPTYPGRITPDPPRRIYSFTYRLAQRPLIFFIAFTVFLSLGALSLLYILISPRKPVNYIGKYPRKKSKIYIKLRELFRKRP